MFRGYWLAAIALGLTLSSVSTAESAKQAEPSQTKSQWQYYTGDYSADLPAFGVRILEEPDESESAKRSQQESAQREIEDLVAQKRMADAADESVWLTKLQFFLGIVGAIALLYSLHLTRKATYAAERAVSAANRATEEASEIGQAQVRAYLSCDSGKFWLREKSIWIEIYLSNRGQSPLRGGESNGRIGCMGRETSGDMYPLNGGFGAIAASGTTTCMLVKSYSGVSEDDIEQLKSGKGTVYINSRFKWTDVFGQELWAEYAISQHTDIKPEIVGGREFMAADLRAVCTDAWREKA